MRASPHHKIKEQARVKNMSNDELYEEAINVNAGDDYDGCFTPNGAITADVVLEEFHQRLLNIGFITK